MTTKTTRTSSTYFDDVGQFHLRMELAHFSQNLDPHLLLNFEFKYRVACLTEEIIELADAHARGDLAAFADALADIVWFALGTAQLAHIPFEEVWAEVRRSNGEKRRWREGDPLKPRNNTQLEVIKPPGWRPPDVWRILHQRVSELRQGVLSEPDPE